MAHSVCYSNILGLPGYMVLVYIWYKITDFHILLFHIVILNELKYESTCCI